MLNFLNLIFEKIAPVFGSVLIATGSFLTPGAISNTQPTSEVATEVSTNKGNSEVTVQETVPKEEKGGFLNKLVSFVPAKNEEVTEQLQNTHVATLQIQGVDMRVDVGAATVTWTTTLPSESRLMLENGEGRVFESESGVSTTHKVRVVGMQESEEYDFKITATTENKSQSDDYYDILYAPKKFTAEFSPNEGECRIILVTDTAGNVAVNKLVQLRPTQVTSSGSITARGNTEVKTNSKGQIRYCEKANTFRLIGVNLDTTLSTNTPQGE